MKPGICVVVVALWLVACERRRDPVIELERRILAPCCYRQSLEDHDSPIAGALRAEVTRRIAAGEAPAQIEQDLVGRYGPQVRAAPPARWAVVLVVAGAIIVGMMLVLRLRRRRVPRLPSATPQAARYADRLEDELAALDGCSRASEA